MISGPAKSGGDGRSTSVRIGECVVTAVVGAAGGLWIGRVLGLELIAALVAGLNGAVSGFYGIYDWRSRRGWAAAMLDSTWGLLGTCQAMVLHIVNVFVPGADYLEFQSYRQNRHVYDRGFRLQGTFALAGGNVISNGGGLVGLRGTSAASSRRRQFVTAHEELHIWQSRLLGPLFQITYAFWAVVGGVIGTVVWPMVPGSLRSVVETTAYYNNPFEYWAYRRDGYWPPSGANENLAWGARRRAAERAGGPQ